MRLSEPLALLLLPAALFVAWYARRRAGNLLAVTRAAIIVLLVLAAAHPVQVQENLDVTEVPRVTVIEDETASMDMFRTGDISLDDLENRTEVNRVQLTGNTSAIGDALERASRDSGAVVMRTDGRVTSGTSLREAAVTAAQRNTTVFAVRPPVRGKDVAVEITGPKNVIAGENTFTIHVRSSGNASYTLDVAVDGSTAVSRTVTQTSPVRSFNVTADLSQGSHEIEATIDAGDDDYFPENDRFTKTVWATAEPRVLLVNGDSSLATVLNQEYRVTESDSIGDLDGYKTVVLNDVPANRLTEDEMSRLSSYVIEGGGLVAVGGRSSYNHGGYTDSDLQRILPVTSEPSQFFGGLNLVLILDISESTREGAIGAGITGTSILDVEKSNAVALIRSLERGDRVAAVAFGGTGFTVLPTRGGWVEAQDSPLLEQQIRRLQQQEGGGTVLGQGLAEAETKLSAVGGTKTVVVITDGGIEGSQEDLQGAAGEIERLRDQGAHVAFVKVRSAVTGNDNVDRLADLADVPMEEVEAGQTADVELRPEETPEGPDRDSYGVTTSRTEHFVTRGLSLRSSVTGFNDVTPKPASDLLAVTDTGRPVLTTWNFGLGRVASLSTDDGSAWASPLYSLDTRLVTRTSNWAIEDPRETDGVLITAPDGWVGSPLPVRVEGAEEQPSLALDGQPVRLSRAGDAYTGSVAPERRGTYALRDYPVAVNYPLEKRVTGFNPALYDLLPATGGRVFETDLGTVDADQLLSEVEVRGTRENSLRPPLMLAALLLFVAEVAYRRWREIKG